MTLVRDKSKAERKKKKSQTANCSFLFFFCFFCRACASTHTPKHPVIKRPPVSRPQQFPSAKCLRDGEGEERREGGHRGNDVHNSMRGCAKHDHHLSQLGDTNCISFFFPPSKEAINRAITVGRAQRSHAGWRLKGAANNLSEGLPVRGSRNFQSRIGTFCPLTTPIYKRTAGGAGVGIQKGN